MAIQPIPARINIWDKSEKYQTKNYITVDFAKTSNPIEGDVRIVGNDADGKRVTIDAKVKQITRYAGKLSDFWRNQFFKKNGLTKRTMSRNWRISNAPALQLDKVTDDDRRVIKQSKGIAFSDEEIADINAVSAFNGQTVRIVSVDPDTEKLQIEGNEKILELRVKVFRAYAYSELPALVSESAKKENETRKLRTLAPYQNRRPTRAMLASETPNLNEYLAKDAKRFQLGGNLYVNFGIQQFNECIGEQIFRNELALFGMDPDLFTTEEILAINEARANEADVPLHAAWQGDITIQPDETGSVPRPVMLEIFKLVDGDSNPQYRPGNKFIQSTEADFFDVYKKGPVLYQSNKLFRHLIGLGLLGNDWIGEKNEL